MYSIIFINTVSSIFPAIFQINFFLSYSFYGQLLYMEYIDKSIEKM